MKPSILTFVIAAPLHAGLLPIGEHVDIRWRWQTSVGWTCEAVTDSNGEVSHQTRDVFFPLSDKPYVAGNPANSGARFSQPSSAAFAFTGVSAGQPLWIAVQGTPGIGEAWPGLENNQSPGTFGSYIPSDPRVSQTTARPWIRISLDSYTPPPGTDARFSLWTTSGSTPKVWMSTYDSSVVDDYYYAEGTHTHMNWGFSALGIHRVRIKASAFAGPGATNPTGSSATHTLTFAIGPFAQWQATHFENAVLDDLAVSGPDADPDHDGMKNLIEYAFGFNPNDSATVPVSNGLGLPKLTLIEQSGTYYEVLEYPRRRSGEQIAPLAYSPEFSSDLVAGNWQKDAFVTTTADFPSEMDGLNPLWEMATSRRNIGNAAPIRGFTRIRVDFVGPP
jgi:surface-anchored protein